MMSISVFASSSGLSIKALRFYDERGLLPPAEVDPVTGYRSYTAGQLRQARLIRVLRAAGMPLEVVGKALAEPDRLAELVDAHRAQLTVERERQDRALAVADEPEPERPAEFGTREVPATHWAAIAYQVDVDQEELDVEATNAIANQHFGRLFTALTEAGNPPIGQFWTTMALTGGAEPLTILLAWPIAEPLPAGFQLTGVELRQGTLPARTEAYVRISDPSGFDNGGLDDLPGGPLPDPTWIAFAEYCEASGAEPTEVRQTTFGQSAEDWEVEYSATTASRT